MMMRKFSAIAAAAIATVALSGACSNGASGSDSSDATLTINQPAAGSTVTVPFTVQFASSEQLGGTSTGLHHVHLYFDNNTNDYVIVEGTTVQVTKAPTGQHMLHLSLRNANHSAAGTETQIALTINGGAGGPSTAPSGESSPGPVQSSGSGGYDY